MDERRSGRRGVLVMLALVAAAIGAVLIVVGVTSQDPEAPALEGPVGTRDTTHTKSDTQKNSSGPPEVTRATGTPLGPSKPVSVSIPAIEVNSEVIALGKAPGGALAVPQPGPNLDKAAWFENSPTPGQPGPSVIEGHVATAEGGPSIFFDLADLRPGDRITVERADGKTVVFEVDALRQFPKDEFPTKLVYGGNLDTPTLRLITCSGFDPAVGSHTANLIVFSHMTGVRGG